MIDTAAPRITESLREYGRGLVEAGVVAIGFSVGTAQLGAGMSYAEP